jgi:hypothetical protein
MRIHGRTDCFPAEWAHAAYRLPIFGSPTTQLVVERSVTITGR